MLELDDTIVAIASSTTPAARGVIRISGQRAIDVLSAMGVDENGKTSAHRVEADIDTGSPLRAIPCQILIWPTDRSYTGQPAAELHTYGSLPVLTALVNTAITSGARSARPGEFTMRAFLAGRLDLTQAEAVLGVIEAEGRGSLDHALRQLAGNLSKPLESMRADLLDLLADVEAGLDFVDEDIEFISDGDLVARLLGLSEQLEQTQLLIRDRGDGTGHATITLRGEPNAGKSLLANRLAGRDAAIVADIAGTTRDVVMIETEIGNQTVTLIDTAGIEDEPAGSTSAEIVSQSQSQASRAAHGSDVRLWCVDASRPDFESAKATLQATAKDYRRGALDLWIATKSDRATSNTPHGWYATSSFTGAGIDELRVAISKFFEAHDRHETGSVIGTAARCRETMHLAARAVSNAIELTQRERGHEFVAAELRTAAQCLGEVTGAVYTDDILDRVFSRFCIGK